MDTGRGTLVQISEAKAEEFKRKDVTGVFQVGQHVQLNGSRFVIHNILRNRLVLKVLKE